MPSKGLKDAEFQKPLTDADFEPVNKPLSDSDFEAVGAPQSVNETRPSSDPLDFLKQGYERAVVKNFGTNPTQSAAWLQERNPDYKVSTSGGEIFFEKNGKKYALDPSGLDVGDVVDIPYDIGSGLATTAAGSAAGLAAAPVTGGAGSIPAAMAASAATGTGLEGLRQKIGKILGVNKEYDPSALKWAAATSAAAPLLFGAATEGQALKAAAAQGLEGEAAKDLANSQRGVISQGWNYALPKLSRIGKDTIETLKEKLPIIREAETSKYPIHKLANEAMGSINKVEKLGEQAGKEGELLRAAYQGQIPLADAKAPILSEIERIKSFPNPSEADKKTLSELERILQQHFPYKSVEAVPATASKLVDEAGAPLVQTEAQAAKSIPIESVPADQSFNIRQNLLDEVNPMKEYRSGAAENATKLSRQALANSEKELIPGAKASSDKYREVQKLLEDLGPKTKSEDRVLNFVKSAANRGKDYDMETLQQIDKKFGTDLVEKSKLAHAFDVFRKSRPVELTAAAAKQRIPAEAVGAGVGGYLGNRSGIGFGAGAGLGFGAGYLGFSPQAVRLYTEMAKKAAPISPWLRYSVLPAANLEMGGE